MAKRRSAKRLTPARRKKRDKIAEKLKRRGMNKNSAFAIGTAAAMGTTKRRKKGRKR